MRCGHCHEDHPTKDEVKACYGLAPAVARAEAHDFSALAAAAVSPVETALGAVAAPSAPPVTAGPSVRRNKFGGRCAKCDVWVEAEEGILAGSKAEGYRVEHDGPCPEKRHLPTAAVFEAVPEGRYAVTGADGTYDFYEVDKPSKGKYAGRVFVALLTGSVGSWHRRNLSHANAATILAKIEAVGAEEAARMFGFKARVCGYCMSPLSNPQSRVAGYGGTCAGNHGWWYPSLSEALTILKERGEDVMSVDDVAETFDATIEHSDPDTDRCQRHGAPLSIGRTVTADGTKFACVECAEEHDVYLRDVADAEQAAASKAHRDEVAAGTKAGYVKDDSSGYCGLCHKPRPTDKNFNLGSTCYC